MINYKIYPTLLDKYQRLLDADSYFESFVNVDQDGNYRRSLADIVTEREQSLLDAINRAPHAPIEAADLGTAFNKAVDLVVEGNALFTDEVAKVKLNDKTYSFSSDLVNEVTELVRWSGVQCYVQHEIDTRRGQVRLYGYIDYVTTPHTLVDLKTTTNYEFGKYSKGWQRYLYSYCYDKTNYNTDMFRYLVVKWRQPTKTRNYYDGYIYTEDYSYVPGRDEDMLREMVESFCDWLEINREKITDKKIFAEE